MTNKTAILAFAAAFGLCGHIQAGEISGTINFDGVATTDTGMLGNATAFSTITGTAVYPQETGDYSSVASGTSATFTPFSFSAAGVTPLWTFTSGGLTYSFDATSIAVVKQTDNFLDIAGDGNASITGFTATPGTWSITDTIVGGNQVFTFGESTAVGSASTGPNTVPDSAMTTLLLGLGLGAIALYRKQSLS